MREGISLALVFRSRLRGLSVRPVEPATPLDRPRARRFVWTLAAVVVGFLAGNLTLVGSVANRIVAEAAGREGEPMGFADYMKVGVPLTLLTTVVGLALLALFGYA